MYADKLESIAALKANITRVLREIEPHLCEDVLQEVHQNTPSTAESRWPFG